MPQPRRITINDLTKEERAALLAEARELSKRNPTDAPGYSKLTKREKAVRALMDARDHMRGCPVQEGTILGRIEGFDAERPPDPTKMRPAQMIGVVRCVECGGSSVFKDPPLTIDEAIAAAEAEAAAEAAAQPAQELVPVGGGEPPNNDQTP